MNRAEEIASNLSTVKQKISTAVLKSGRELDQITLIAVTKTFPMEDLSALKSLSTQKTKL